MNVLSSEGEASARLTPYNRRGVGSSEDSRRERRVRMTRLWLGVTCCIGGILFVPAAAMVYLRVGTPPVAVTDPAFPYEKAIVHVPLDARIRRDEPKSIPIQATPENLIAGAAIYKQQCAFCHGVPNHDSPVADHMYPPAPQLWKSHRPGVVGVSDDPAGETFWKVKNGIRLAGMPAYADLLSEDQMWQVSLLVSKADQPLPPPAQANLVP